MLFKLAHNVLRVAAVGDFGALHCQPAQRFDRSTQLQFCTSPPIEATRCYRLVFCLSILANHCQYLVSVSLSVGCVWRFLFFLKGREIFKNNFYSLHYLFSKVFVNASHFLRWLCKFFDKALVCAWACAALAMCLQNALVYVFIFL